jgi:alginate O-acetyltransferase complex protein AlgJ
MRQLLRFLARRSVLWRLPILVSAAMIVVPSLLVYGNALHKVVAGVPMFSDTRLRGVQVPAPMPELTLQSLASGEFPRQYAAYFGQHFPLLAPAVRMKAQFYWSVLRESPVGFITLGRKQVLYETSYINEYCSRNIDAFKPIAEAWAAKLMQIQRRYADRDKIFLYVITPSKPSIEPEWIPGGWPCTASLADRSNFHAAYRAILDQAGVNVVDAVETTMDAKRNFPFPPFPRGGTHFNAVSAALAAQQVITVLAQVGTWRRMDSFNFTWTMGEPSEVDTDLRDAMNVPYTGMNYQTPRVSLELNTVAQCTPVLMGQVGGSFTYEINRILQRTACPPKIDLYEYYRNTMAFYPGDRRFPVDPERRAWFLLDAAEVVLLEENEEMVGRSEHGQAFYDLIASRMEAVKPMK